MMSERPNVVLIICHDLGQHLGCYGIPTVDTPNIDRLGAQGVRFERSFCVAPQCSPSRAAIFTGRYPHSNGVMGLVHAGFKWDLHDSETHLARRFGQAGYHTSLVGVIHETPHPENMGFDEIHLRDRNATQDGMGLADRAADWLSDPARKHKPFYLQMGLIEPHRSHTHPTQWPPTHRPARLQATIPPYLQPTQGAAEEMAFFEASVRTADDAVGRVLDALDEAELAENTLVIFTADHGIPFPRSKCTLYDPGLEVPLIMRWPAGPLAAGIVWQEMISNVDYVPTLCDLLDLPEATNSQGRSFAPLLRGEGDYQPRDEMFAEMTYHDYYDPLRAIRTNTHKLIVSFCYNHAIMDPTQQWWRKVTTIVPPDPHAARHPLVELYDLGADPLERTNLADDPAHAGIRAELLGRLHEWMRQSGDPLLEGIPISPTHHEALAALRGAGADK
jgi:arylsulfatase A-like enzyme